MRQRQVDLAVLGSGPAGQKGAIQAAKLGKLVNENGRWSQVMVILLSLTFFTLAGILAVLALS